MLGSPAFCSLSGGHRTSRWVIASGPESVLCVASLRRAMLARLVPGDAQPCLSLGPSRILGWIRPSLLPVVPAHLTGALPPPLRSRRPAMGDGPTWRRISSRFDSPPGVEAGVPCPGALGPIRRPLKRSGDMVAGWPWLLARLRILLSFVGLRTWSARLMGHFSVARLPQLSELPLWLRLHHRRASEDRPSPPLLPSPPLEQHCSASTWIGCPSAHQFVWIVSRTWRSP